MIAAVIFDRDNTLVQLDMAPLAARLAQAAPAVPAEQITRHWVSWPGPWPRAPEEEASFWRTFWQALDPPCPPGLLDTLCAISADYAQGFRAHADALPTLSALRAAGLRLAVLTNFPLPDVAATLKHAGIDPAWFDVLLSSAALGVEKPDPRAYHAVAESLGLPPQACCYVDDHPPFVAAALAEGMHAFVIDRSPLAPPDDGLLRIHDLRDLLALLTTLEDHR